MTASRSRLSRTSRPYTSIDEARALGIEASAVVKMVAVRVGRRLCPDGGPGDWCSTASGAGGVGDRHVRLATEEELLRDFPWLRAGRPPPLWLAAGAPLYVDQEVRQHETVVFAAGAKPNRSAQDCGPAPARAGDTLLLTKQADDNDKDLAG